MFSFFHFKQTQQLNALPCELTPADFGHGERERKSHESLGRQHRLGWGILAMFGFRILSLPPVRYYSQTNDMSRKRLRCHNTTVLLTTTSLKLLSKYRAFLNRSITCVGLRLCFDPVRAGNRRENKRHFKS